MYIYIHKYIYITLRQSNNIKHGKFEIPVKKFTNMGHYGTINYVWNMLEFCANVQPCPSPSDA